MRYEEYKEDESAEEIVDATWGLLTREGWGVEMRNPQNKKREARYVGPFRTRSNPTLGSDGFEKVLIGTRGARETFLRGRKDERRRTAF